MVNSVKVEGNDDKIRALYQQIKEAKDPIEVDNLQIQIDNLLDIRLMRAKMREATDGN